MALKHPWHGTRRIFRSEDESADELSEDLKLEAVELLETLTVWYSEMGGAPPESGEVSDEQVNEVFRALHTLKGLCMMGNLEAPGKILHALEDRIDSVRSQAETFSQEIFDQLGDLIKILEQFFAFFPDEVPELVTELFDEHQQRFGAGGDRGEPGSSAPEPQATEAPEVETEPESLVDDSAAPESEFADEVMGSAAAAATEEVGSESGGGEEISAEAGDPDDPGEVDISPTSGESIRFAEFCGRPENIMAAIYSGEEFPSREAVKAFDGYENLTRVVEIIYERTAPPHGTLIVFASDLDAEMAGLLGNVSATALESNDLALASFPEPWNLVAFDSSEAEGLVGEVEASAPAAESAAPQPVLSEEVAEPANETESVEPEASSAASPQDLPYEDFDSGNREPAEAAMELDEEMVDDFLTNADELMEELSQSMLDLEGDPENSEAIDTIFRAAHTIKGTAGMFGFRAIEKLTHVMENTFDRMRKGELKATSAMMDGLLEALDRIRACFEALKEGKSAELPINEALNKVLQADFAAQNGIELEPSPSRSTSEAEKQSSSDEPSEPAPSALTPQREGDEASGDKEGGDKKAAKKKKAEGVGTIRVDLKRLDALVNLVGELVIDRTRFARIEETLRMAGQNSELLHTMSETLLLFGRHMNDVQSIIMKIRMVPVGNAFYKFTRVVRDLARTCGKEIELLIEGGETELDKTLVEEIGDPLVHIIRNSADHGIEMPEDRVAAGKEPKGTITLRAYQDGNMIVIFVSDDGKGLQAERIRQKAIQKGLIAETDQLTEKEIYNLIFEPGFSTAEQVTNISGRGVGMDAVKKSIVKLKGVVDIDSTEGHGTQISIKLPLTLAIIPSLLVESCGETYAIPLVNVIESIRIGPEDVQRIGHSDFVKLREQVMPLLKLADIFSLNDLSEKMWYAVSEDAKEEGLAVPSVTLDGEGGLAQGPEADLEQAGEDAAANESILPATSEGRLNARNKRKKKPRLIFVVVGVGEQRVGFIVDQLMGQQEIVIKSLGRILGRTRGVSGGCVLGNGRVALVLDVGELIEDHSDSGRGGMGRVA